MKQEIYKFLKELGATNICYSGHKRCFVYINQEKKSCFISVEEAAEIKKLPKKFHKKLIF